jgi:uncharacterized protein YcbK (DUF882 family)
MTPLLTIALSLVSGAVDLADVLKPIAPASIAFTFQNRHETESFTLLDQSGAVRPEVLPRLSHFVRCWRTEREKPMHPRLVEIVARVADHFHADEVEVISGYRARPYGSPHSKHFLGRAMDIHVPGVPAKQVWQYVWSNFRHVGTGYYPRQEFVHVDVRDEDVKWIDTSRHGESAHARYFSRPADDLLPADAPRLAYDEEARALAVAGVGYLPDGGLRGRGAW